jgi:hypothetical protein
MQIGILSDTHDNHRSVRRAIEIFNERDTECVLHAGDMTGAGTASLFAQLRSRRFVVVTGNCDADRVALRQAVETFGGEVYESSFDGQVGDKAVYMAHIPHSVKRAIDSQSYDLVVYGHTHQQDTHRVGKTLIVNPGSARNGLAAGGHIAIVDLADMSVTFESLV